MSKKPVDHARQTLADFTFVGKYPQYLPSVKRRETRAESIRRMMDMHREFYADKGVEAEIDEAERALMEDRVLGSQRALQFGGRAMTDIRTHKGRQFSAHIRGYNCAGTFCDRPEVFAEAFWVLLCGAGAGISFQLQHVAKLPRMVGPGEGRQVHVVADSIEGWADSLQVLLDSYWQGTPRVSFDYSEVRREGSRLKSSSGKAPGPKPLRDALEKIRAVCDRVVAEGGVIRPIHAYDIHCNASSAVRAGGIRRSATIALFSLDDQEMMSCKTGEWLKENPQRQYSNNSVMLLRGAVSRERFDEIFHYTREFGDPGYYWVDSLERVCNPCSEATFDPVDHLTGKTGWSFCNLSTINMAKVKSLADLLAAARAAAILGTLQAGYQDPGYLTETTRALFVRDALLGVSLTGMAECMSLSFDPQALEAGVDVIRRTNEEMAAKLGINTAARLTMVKPEGTGSMVLQTSSGITPWHARKGLRLQWLKSTEPHLQYLLEHIPEAVFPSAYASNEMVVAFPWDLGDNPDLWLKTETDPIDHLRKVVLVQRHWVKAGQNRGDFCNSVSNTIRVPDGDWQRTSDFIFDHQYELAGVSLLGDTGDLAFPQAPYISYRSPEEIEAIADPEHRERAASWSRLYDRLVQVWRPVDFAAMMEDDDNTNLLDNVACAAGQCEA